MTVVGGIGEHGMPALKHVVRAIRPQPGKLLHTPMVEGVLVVGGTQGHNTAINDHVQEECYKVRGQPLPLWPDSDEIIVLFSS